MNSYINTYLAETVQIIETIDRDQIAAVINILRKVKANRGRLFILGLGGSAANASHAVNDFRKIVFIPLNIEFCLIRFLSARVRSKYSPIFPAMLSIKSRSSLRNGPSLILGISFK